MRSGNIFVIVEHDGTDVLDVTLELLGDARQLCAKFSGEVWAVMLSAPIETLPDAISAKLTEHGASRILLVEHELFEQYLTEAYVGALAELCARFAPALVMAAASVKGQDYAPRLAARLQAPFAADCISFKVLPDGMFTATRPICSDKIHETLALHGDLPYVVTLRPNVAGFGKGTPRRDTAVDRIAVDLDAVSIKARVVRAVPADPATVDLTEADIIVAGGRGVGEREGWSRIEELAELLHASVGASRIAVDLGWSPALRQVGQSGKIVRTKLYVACGISGASQHLAGMLGCEVIVAINVDKAAPIMKIAHLSVEGDLHEIIPEISRLVRPRAGTVAGR